MGITMKNATVAAALTVASTIGCAKGVPLQMASAGRRPEVPRYVTFFVQTGNARDNRDVDRELHAGIVTALVERGLVETSPGEAEAVVIVNRATEGRRSRDTFYQGWGGWAWRVEDARSPNGLETYDVGSLVIDIFDAWTKTLVWHGSTPHAFSADARASDHTLERAVNRLFEHFPPEGLEQVRSTDPGPSSAHDQPRSIIFSPRPAFLVRIDGKPGYEEVDGTRLRRITNANALIVIDDSGMQYMRLAGRWLEAYDVTGDWSPAGTLPAGADVALQEAIRERRDDPLLGVSARDPMPDIVVALTPADLIVTDGEPEYARLPGTSLQQITNTTAKVFREPTDGELYVRSQAGWFRAWTTNGPWQRIAEGSLPADLALLPTRFTGQSGPS